MGDDYANRQAMKDATYAREYKAWLKTLTPEERYQVKQLGLAEPLLPTDGNGFLDEDAADTPMAFVPAAEVIESPEPTETVLQADQVWDILRRLIGELLAERNARLTLECLALVSGMSFLGDSMAAVARRHGVTRAAVSKRCIDLTERLNVLPSRAMRSLTARRAYKKAQITLRHDYERFGQHHS
jgi:hypothetical protein